MVLPSPIHIKEKIGQCLGPGLAILFMNEDEFSEEMGHAKCMQAGEVEIGFPAIMDEPSHEVGQDGKCVQRFSATFLVNPVPGQGWGREDMKPVERIFHS